MKNSNLIKKIKYFIIYKLLQYIICYICLFINAGFKEAVLILVFFSIYFISLLMISIVVNIILQFFIKNYKLAIIVADIISLFILVIYEDSIIHAFW
jgi:hypothetical protein